MSEQQPEEQPTDQQFEQPQAEPHVPEQPVQPKQPLPVSVAEVMARAAWKPMSGAQGRFMLAEPTSKVTVRELTGPEADLHVLPSQQPDEKILVVPLEGGGLISTRRPNGHEVHTLNTDSEFRRRLLALGIHPREYRVGLY